MDFALRLAANIIDARDVDHHPDSLHWAKFAITDTIGVALAGADTETAKIVRRVYARHQGNAHLIKPAIRSMPRSSTAPRHTRLIMTTSPKI